MIVAVVVTYQPERTTLCRLLCALVPQVSFAVIVDNGSPAGIERECSEGLPQHLHGKVVVVSLEDNRGLATAQNIGIAWAKKKGADYILLSDQDSLPHDAMVKELLSAAEHLRMREERLACVGPRYLDPRHDNPPPFLRVQGLRLKRLTCGGNPVMPVDYLIASGCLIPMDVLEKVGGMRDDLFIDYVDIEWGLRARRLGYQSFGVCAALMTHCLGETPMRFFHRRVPVHSPLRHYYHFRNAILIYKQPGVPLNWKLVDGSRLLMRYGFYTFLTKPRFSHWRMMTLGIWHGLRGKGGKCGAAG
ncbi:glycosyltransferase family 2 protein [Methylobacter sp.]